MSQYSRILAALFGAVFSTSVFAQAMQPAPAAKPVAPPAASKPAPAAKPAPSADLLDINSATKEQLDALPGVGEARSEAIIKGRPYKGKDELYQKKIIPKSLYDKIKDKIIAKQK
jgi:DNA uptake protein ComE-like DNA-binding protein